MKRNTGKKKQDGRITVGIKEAEAAIEAILFAMGDSVELEKIAKAIDQDTATTRKIIEGMMDEAESLMNRAW